MDGVTTDRPRGIQFRCHVIEEWRRWLAGIAALMCCLATVYWYEAWVSHHLRWQRARIETVFDKQIDQKPPADCPHYQSAMTVVKEAFKVKALRPYHSIFTREGERWTVPPEKLSQFEVDLIKLTSETPPSRELVWKALDLVEGLTPPNYFVMNRRLALEDVIGPRTATPLGDTASRDES